MIEANRLIHIIERFERINFYAKGGQCFLMAIKASVQISIWIILNKCHILTFKHFTVDKKYQRYKHRGHQVCPIKLANIDSGLMVDFQKRRIEYTDLGHQVLRENQTRPSP